MTRILRSAPVLSLALLAGPFAAAAQEPPSASPTTRLIAYAAILPDAGPDSVAGARSVTFALFDDAEGGTLLWSETQTVTVDARGRFNAHLGAVTPLPAEIFRTEQARWLEVSIDGQALPRTMVVAVPYALRAADAETLGGTPASEFVRTDAAGRRVRTDGTTIEDPLVDGTGVPNQLAKWSTGTTLSSSILTESFDNRLGVLAPDPTGGGAVDSRVTIRNPDNNTAFGVLGPFNQRRFALNTLSNGGWILYDGAGGGWNDGLRQREGNVSLGVIPQSVVRMWIDATGTDTAIVADGDDGIGLEGRSHSAAGVIGFTVTGAGAVTGVSTGTGPAGRFQGNVTITGNASVGGTLTKGAGAFRIDHPLDPANKYLSHSFVESPDMMNVYNGNVTLDVRGEAWVTMPEWFEPLNRDFRYQLTPIGAPGPNLYIAEEVSNNRFRIAGGTPGGRVSWQVTGIRHDAFANKNRIPVEEDKTPRERGFYLHPAAFDRPVTFGLPSPRLEPTKRAGGGPLP